MHANAAADLSSVARYVLALLKPNRRLIETFKQIGTLLDEADREAAR